MADARLQIVIDAINNATAELKALQKEMGDVSEATKDADKSQSSFKDTFSMTLLGINQGIQIIQQLGAAAKAAFDFTYEGAQIRQTGIAFESLTSQIDLGEDAIQEWRAAVNGTVTDLELMTGFQTLAAGVSRELTQEFANNNAQLLAISKAASALNPSLGDTAFMYESITRGIKRASPMILDNLGIIVKVGEANENLAVQLGKTVDELTAEEKQMALLNEVLKSGDTLISQLGDTVESAVDPWDRFTTAVGNARNAQKEASSETGILTGALEVVTNLLNQGTQNLEELADAHEVLDSALGFGIISQEEYAEAINLMTKYGAPNLEMINRLREGIENQSGAVGLATEDLSAYYEFVNGEWIPVQISMNDLVGENTSTLTSYKDMVKIAKDAIEEANIPLEEKLRLLEELALATGELTEEQITLTDMQDTLNAAFITGSIDADTLQKALVILGDESLTAAEKAARINDELNGIPRTVRSDIFVTTYKRTVNMDENKGGSGGGGGTGGQSGDQDPSMTATGGPITAGNPYQWQEYGYKGEVFVPSMDGFVLSRADAKRILSEAGKGGGGGGNTYNLTMPTTANPNDVTMAFEIMEAMGAR